MNARQCGHIEVQKENYALPATFQTAYKEKRIELKPAT